MTKLIDGKALKDKILAELAGQISEKGLKPKLEIVLVGDDEPSLRYIGQKQKAAQEIGAISELHQLAESSSQEEVINLIQKLNSDQSVTGIIVQLPLPPQLDKEKILGEIKREKDVDGLTLGSPFSPATPSGVMEILHEYHVLVKDKTAAVLGQSQLVGSPLSSMLEQEGARVVRIDINTPEPIEQLVQQADIAVSAVGKVGLVTESMVKPGAVVIDVGTNIDPGTGKLVGDVDFEKVAEKASLITPVPGGVGPMTVAMLMKNLVRAASIDK